MQPRLGHWSRDGPPCELSLTPQGTEVIGDLCSVELSAIIEDHYSRDAKVGDDIFIDKLSHFRHGDGNDDLNLYPFYKVIHRNKEVLSLIRGFWEMFQYVHSPSGKR